MILIVATIAAVLLAPYILGPILVWRNNSSPAVPSFDVLEPQELPPAIRQTFLSQVIGLEHEGFSMAAYLKQSGPMVTTFLALMANRNTGDMAMVVDMTSNSGSARLQTSYVEFSTHYADGLNIDTNNTSQVGVFRKTQEKLTFKFSEIRVPRVLYTIHRRLLAAHRSRSSVVAPAEGQETQELVRSMIRDLTRQERYGYFYLDAAAAVYRPTLKGAVLMTWRVAWPVSIIRRALEQKASAAALRATAV